VSQVLEKPAGARKVSKYEARIERTYYPIWTTRLGDPVFFDADTCARLHIVVDFYDDDAATEFQAKIIAMMPGVES
jgi:hypothetical protein